MVKGLNPNVSTINNSHTIVKIIFLNFLLKINIAENFNIQKKVI